MLKRVLEPWQDVAYAALRIAVGLMLACHGAQKLFGMFSHGPTAVVGSQMWFGGVIELAGGLAVALGLCTRAAAILVSGTMAVAYFQFHWKLAGGERVLPIVNGGELAVAYCFLFLYIATRGGGRFSFDGRRAS